MNNKFPRFLAILLLVVSVSACQTNGWGGNQTMGTLLGAGLGGFTGSHIGKGNGQLAAVAVGTLGGAIVGGEIGANMDRQRQMTYGYPPPVAYPPPHMGYGFGGYAGCDTLGATSQARADCVRGLADANARRDAWGTRWNQYR